MSTNELKSPNINRPAPVQDLNWSTDDARRLALEVLDLWCEYLDDLPSFRVACSKPQPAVKDALTMSVPSAPMPLCNIMHHLRTLVYENTTYSGHPRFAAYVTSSGTVPGAVGDFLASAIGFNLRGWLLAPGATEIELELTRWMASICGLPEGSGGLMVSGGAVANFTALKVARDVATGFAVRKEGIRNLPQMTLYASSQAHIVIERAADMLGLGSAAVRVIDVDSDYRMRTDLLTAAIEEDLANGLKPIAVVGTAGTTATGSIDPLPEIAAICKRFGLWFHVDGAYGASAVLSEELRPQFKGIEQADSIAWDPHKWLYMPQSAGCVLFRNLQLAADGFAVHPSYTYQDKVETGRGMDMSEFGPQFGRSFQALKLWLSLLAYGTDAYSRRIAHDTHLAQYFGERVQASPDFELVLPVKLSICCFRYVPQDLPAAYRTDEYLNRLNSRLLTAIQMDGRVFLSNAVLGGVFALRICIVNVRTEADDLDKMLEVVAELGKKLDAQLRSES